MIYLIIGTNAFRIEQEITQLVAQAAIVPEQIDASALDANKLADIMRGGMLFATKRIVVIRELSEQKSLWSLVAEWAEAKTNDTTLILVEAKPDRRTKAYKILAKVATIINAPQWTDRESGRAEEWLRNYAAAHQVSLSPRQIKDMVSRSMVAAERGMVVDQFQLAHAIDALALVDEVVDEAIATVLPAAMKDVLFELIGFAANREEARVYQALASLRLNEDPYKVFPVLAAEWSRLVAVAVAGNGSSASIATELELHPYVVQKLQGLTRLFTRQQLHDLTKLAADIDAGMKQSQFAPWDGIDRFVIGVALRR